MKIFFLLSAVLFSGMAFGQFTETLDKNNVSAVVSADGHLFYDPAATSAGYEIPKGSGINAIFCQNLWFGSLEANGQLRIAAQRFGGDSTDFFPGPYSSNGSYDDPNYVSNYIPALWKVSKADIDAHVAEYANNGSVSNPHPTILNWPANGDPLLGTGPDLAPFVDVNFDGVYDPYGGDYPAIKGCEGLYIIMNDSKTAAGGTGTPSLDIEVHILLYQYASLNFLNDITFMDIRVINRGTTDLADFVSATYTDADIGNPMDDYMGSAPNRNLIYQFNGDLNDEDFGGSLGYGLAPPAIAVKYLNQTMAHAGYFTNGSPSAQSDPSTAAQYWNYMNGKWRFGDDWIFGGTGFPGSVGATNLAADFMFPGYNDPTHTGTGGISPSFIWDEETNNNPPGDRRMFLTSEQGTLAAGAEFEIHQAIIYGRSQAQDLFASVNTMLDIADSVQNFYDAGIDQCNDPFASIQPIQTESFSLYPNPSQGMFTIEIPNLTSGMSVQVMDVYGKLVYSSPIDSSEMKIDLNESAGLYFVTVLGNGSKSTTKLILE